MKDTQNFLSINISILNKKDIVNKILEFVSTEKCKFITYLNAHCVNISYSDIEYRDILQNMDMVYSGGQGVVWAGRFLGIPIPERVNVLDFFDELVKELKNRKTTVYLLGETDNVIKKTADILKEKGINIAGAHNGFFDEAQENFIIQEINKLQPAILMVGMGAPTQEKWMFKHKEDLNVRLCWGVGGVFKLLCGDLKRAPRWIINCGLEWLYIGLQDPKRLFKRYLIGNFIFIYHVLINKITKNASK